MAYEKSKGLIAVATGFSGEKYSYEKLDAFIGKEDYSATPDQMQDIDSYVNANGYLKRTLMPHSRSKIEINTTYLMYDQKRELVTILKKGMRLKDGKCNEAERKLRIRFYNDWEEDYSYAFCYISDVTFQSGGTYRGEPSYLPIRLAFIEY